MACSSWLRVPFSIRSAIMKCLVLNLRIVEGDSVNTARWEHCGHALPIWQAGIQDRLLFGDIVP